MPLNSIKNAIDLAKIVKGAADDLRNVELNLKIVDLMSSLVEIKFELIEKDEKISQLEKKLKIENEMIYEKPYYFLIRNEKRDGPYCQLCYDNDNKLIRLQGGGIDYWDCRCCKRKYRDSNYIQKRGYIRVS